MNVCEANGKSWKTANNPQLKHSKGEMYGILKARKPARLTFLFPLNPKGDKGAPRALKGTPQVLTSDAYASTVEALTHAVHTELKRQNR